jgi:CheY-like chemotaxis protein
LDASKREFRYMRNARAGIGNDSAKPARRNVQMQSPQTNGRIPDPAVLDIVIIEEDKLMQGLLLEWLSAEGYSVRADAPGHAQASDKADLVIVDVYMPRHEGANALRAVKAAHPQTPLIAISGQFRPGLVGPCAAADALGVRQVIAKPFSRHDLLAAVRSMIGPAGRLTGT